jgi:sodium transport system permease protein
MRNIMLVYRKELLDIIRDRRTIISMVVIPILIFPLMTVGFSALASSFVSKTKAEIQKVALVNGALVPALSDSISASGKVQIVEADADSIEKAILAKEIRAAIVIPDSYTEKLAALDTTMKIEILYDESDSKSDVAGGKLRTLLNNYRRDIVKSRFQERMLDPSIIEPFKVESRNVASKEKMGSFLLSLFLPYMILILSLTGAMYTAMDLTAGEKERGTMETILVSPIPRWHLATGKFLTILTTSIITTILAIMSMAITFGYAFAASGAMGGEFALKVSPTSIITILLLMIPTASLFSAVLMSVSLTAKTYKEAQSYVTPIMFIVIMPAMVSFLPGIELGWGLAFVPIVNIALMIKEAMIGTVNFGFLALIFVSTAIYAAFAIFIAHRLFEKESVIFNN